MLFFALLAFFRGKNLAQNARLSQIALHAFSQTSLWKRGSPGGEQPEGLMGVIFEP
jgi:hypothetical protein